MDIISVRHFRGRDHVRCLFSPTTRREGMRRSGQGATRCMRRTLELRRRFEVWGVRNGNRYDEQFRNDEVAGLPRCVDNALLIEVSTSLL